MKLHKENLFKISAAVGVLFLTFAMAVGVTQARYNNTASWSGYYAPGVQKVTSDLLKWEGQTIVLQPMEALAGTSRVEEIQLFTNKNTADVTVQCSTGSDYITAALEQNTLTATQAGATARLRLTVTEKAGRLTQQMQEKVSVSVRDAEGEMVLKADYQLTLFPQGMSPAQPQESNLEAGLTVSSSIEEGAFAWEEKLVFALTAAQNADSVELMYNGGAFPKGTRYSVDQNQYVLGDAMNIKIPIAAGVAKPITLDFSQTGETAQPTVDITAVAYLGVQITDQISFSARADRTPLAIRQMGADPVIAHNGSITVPVSGDEEGLILLVQHLKKTNSGTMYVQADTMSMTLRPDGEDDGNYLLEISNKSGKAVAGTYRLTLIRMCGDQLVSTCQMAFFVHY